MLFVFAVLIFRFPLFAPWESVIAKLINSLSFFSDVGACWQIKTSKFLRSTNLQPNSDSACSSSPSILCGLNMRRERDVWLSLRSACLICVSAEATRPSLRRRSL